MCIVVLQKWLRTNCVLYLKKCTKRYPQKTCDKIEKSLKIIKNKIKNHKTDHKNTTHFIYNLNKIYATSIQKLYNNFMDFFMENLWANKIQKPQNKSIKRILKIHKQNHKKSILKSY